MSQGLALQRVGQTDLGSLASTEKRKGSKTARDIPVEGTGKEESQQPAKGIGGDQEVGARPGEGRSFWQG